MSKLTHTNASGNAEMVDVSGKSTTAREAKAEVTVRMLQSTLDQIYAGDIPKGDVLTVARVAAIQAAKRTCDLIPLCHPLPISKIDVSFDRKSATELLIATFCKVEAKTGVEMEALTAASIAALTVYDMCKGVEKGIRIDGLRLIEKSGGKSGKWMETVA